MTWDPISPELPLPCPFSPRVEEIHCPLHHLFHRFSVGVSWIFPFILFRICCYVLLLLYTFLFEFHNHLLFLEVQDAPGIGSVGKTINSALTWIFWHGFSQNVDPHEGIRHKHALWSISCSTSFRKRATRIAWRSRLLIFAISDQWRILQTGQININLESPVVIFACPNHQPNEFVRKKGMVDCFHLVPNNYMNFSQSLCHCISFGPKINLGFKIKMIAGSFASKVRGSEKWGQCCAKCFGPHQPCMPAGI